MIIRKALLPLVLILVIAGLGLGAYRIFGPSSEHVSEPLTEGDEDFSASVGRVTGEMGHHDHEHMLADPMDLPCSEDDRVPACAVIRGQKQDFENACLAQKAGARIEEIQVGRCSDNGAVGYDNGGDKAPEGRCPDLDLPVCGTVASRQVTFKNQCEADRAGALNVIGEACPPGSERLPDPFDGEI